MWLSVLIAWIAVRWFGAGLGTVWFAFVLTTAPASLLMWWVYRRRIADFEQGRREFPDLSATPPDIEGTERPPELAIWALRRCHSERYEESRRS